MTLMDRIADMGATLLIVPALIGFSIVALVTKIPFFQDRLGLALVMVGLLFVGLGLTTGVML